MLDLSQLEQWIKATSASSLASSCPIKFKHKNGMFAELALEYLNNIPAFAIKTAKVQYFFPNDLSNHKRVAKLICEGYFVLS